MNKVPLELYSSNIYPYLGLLEMIRLTHSISKLQPITRKFFVDKGYKLGFKNIVYPKDLLMIIEWKKDMRKEFDNITNFIAKEVYCFLFEWLCNETNQNYDEVTQMLQSKRDKIENRIYSLLQPSFRSFKEDLERCLEPYTDKLLWKFETYKKYMNDCNCVLSGIFWSFELEVMTTIKKYLFKYSVDIFSERGSDLDIESLELNSIIKGNIGCNLNRKLYQMIYSMPNMD